jgi:hypothetical protein
MKTLIWLLLFMLIPAPLFSAQIDRPIVENDIREAVFRYQIQHWDSDGDYGDIFFLSLSGMDPNNKFMGRFIDYGKRAKKKTQAASEIMTGVKDKQTGKPGIILEVAEITWISGTEVKVQGGYYQHGKSASWNTYYLKRRHGKWAVTKDVVGPIA